MRKLKPDKPPVDRCPACRGGLFAIERPGAPMGTLWHCDECDWDSDYYDGPYDLNSEESTPAAEVTP